jgi:hypothetical protein
MEKTLALSIAKQIATWSTSTDSAYEIDPVETVGGVLQGFHQWSDGKPFVAGFHVAKRGEESYYFLFIDWHRNDNYYLAIYMHDRSTTVAEIQRLVDVEGHPCLVWKYNPLKRDGKNAERKAYFVQAFGSTEVHITLPNAPQAVEPFCNALFTLSRNRQNADRIVTVFVL